MLSTKATISKCFRGQHVQDLDSSVGLTKRVKVRKPSLNGSVNNADGSISEQKEALSRSNGEPFRFYVKAITVKAFQDEALFCTNNILASDLSAVGSEPVPMSHGTQQYPSAGNSPQNDRVCASINA